MRCRNASIAMRRRARLFCCVSVEDNQQEPASGLPFHILQRCWRAQIAQRPPDTSGRVVCKNEVPWEIVRIFEKHGFIWGGKWYHYDTMHFSYRPEMLINAK